ncbi:MAG: L-seryl-tRNA(Sec) selenium transferase [bacterium]
MNDTLDPRRKLPSVDALVQMLDAQSPPAGTSHALKVDAARRVLDDFRARADDVSIPERDEILARLRAELESLEHLGLRRVVNGTGIVLHTNLGRAVLPRAAMAAVADLDGYCGLQIDLESGRRGRRDAGVENLLRRITGAEAATVVNNNAAATLLVLSSLCAGREVIVSRGQLIEIGGSFRLPDVIAQSGARMVEVGTTNKTHPRDYENAITEDTRVLLRVNPSNYRITGFTRQVSTAELAEIKQGRDLILVDDLGCGALVDLPAYGLPPEPAVQDSLRAGADVALFSGDKLIGGPQSGIIVGRRKYIDLIRKHPLARALRVGKFTIAALEATLKLFLNPETLEQTHPILRMLTVPYPKLHARALALLKRISPFIPGEVIAGESACGGGSLPDWKLKTALLALRHEAFSAGDLARRLRMGDPPVVAVVRGGRVCIDVRTLLEGDDERIAAAVQRAVNPTGCP